ncbi:MAG: TetR/AcrR family transcriptional regulator, partial [Ilumatobacteraceae bacterium]
MARTPDIEMKRALLDQVVAYLAEHGLGDVSLRPMAAALGTSPNRLVHHFGSKQDLLTAALQQATKIQEDVRDEWLRRHPGLSKTAEMRKWWKWLNESPANLALTRLGLEAVTLEATHTG